MQLVQTHLLTLYYDRADGVPIANGHVDLVVPADKVAEFEQMTASMTTEVMHEDLGASIEDEGQISVYRGA